MVVLAQVVFHCLETKACIIHILKLGEQFITLNKNLLGALKCEHMKSLGGFASIGISVKVD
jgi:hypothetical protein